MGVFTRARRCILPLLRAVDLLACTVWLSLFYTLGLADRPTGRDLISSYVGKAAYNGTRWGLRMSKIIDRLALWVGDQPGHCERAYLFYHRLET